MPAAPDPQPAAAPPTAHTPGPAPASPSPPRPAARVTDLGRLAYAPALELQRAIHQRVRDRLDPPTILLVEHDPVITISQRRDAAAHLLAGRDLLARRGIDVQPTDRGGDITYHGPGQLVVYPILPLNDLGLNLSRYMRVLEQSVIDAAAAWGIEALRDPGATGVWARVAPTSQRPEASLAKLCALGVRIGRNVTMHGLALNVATDLSHFDLIVPCGLPGRGVTSLHALLGPAAPDMARVKADLVARLLGRLGLEAIPPASPAR